MDLTKILISYVLTSIVFFAIDMLWLGLIAKNLYRNYLGHFLSDEVNWVAAIIFYLIFIAGILFFAVYPAVQKESFVNAIILGALFGFFTYATYDLTNYATLKDWPIQIVFIDIAWGAFLSAMVSLSGYFIMRFVN